MNKRKVTINILCIIGLCLTIELINVYINANVIENGTPSICAISKAYNCDTVAKSPFSQFLGIPLALWGFILYIFFLFMNNIEAIYNKTRWEFLTVFKNPNSYMHCVGVISFVISMGLAMISEVIIQSLCIFCLMTYFINLFIAIAAKEWGKGFWEPLKTSVKDFFSAFKVPRYAVAFSLLVILFFGTLYYTETTKILAPNMWHSAKNTKDIYLKETYGNILGNEKGDLVINEYIDFNCAGCFYATLYLHRVALEFKNVKIIQHNVPLEKVCNHNMKSAGHKNSCLKARYALAAAKQNKYWIMADLLFFTPNIEDENTIVSLAKKSKFDVKKLKEDANSEEITEELKNSILEADSKKIDVTPTIFIGMKRLEGIPSWPEFEKIVIEQGGIKK